MGDGESKTSSSGPQEEPRVKPHSGCLVLHSLLREILLGKGNGLLALCKRTNVWVTSCLSFPTLQILPTQLCHFPF